MKFNIMDATGHTEEVFGSDKLSTEQAMARFAELTGKGYRAAVPGSDGNKVLTKAFDPTAVEHLFFPALQGG